MSDRLPSREANDDWAEVFSSQPGLDVIEVISEVHSDSCSRVGSGSEQLHVEFEADGETLPVSTPSPCVIPETVGPWSDSGSRSGSQPGSSESKTVGSLEQMSRESTAIAALRADLARERSALADERARVASTLRRVQDRVRESVEQAVGSTRADLERERLDLAMDREQLELDREALGADRRQIEVERALLGNLIAGHCSPESAFEKHRQELESTFAERVQRYARRLLAKHKRHRQRSGALDEPRRASRRQRGARSERRARVALEDPRKSERRARVAREASPQKVARPEIKSQPAGKSQLVAPQRRRSIGRSRF